MEILNEYIVFIIFFLIGLFFEFVVSLIFLKINMVQFENYLIQNLCTVLGRLLMIEGVIAAIFNLAGTMYEEKILQIGFLTTITIVLSKIFTYTCLAQFESITEADIVKYKLRNRQNKVTFFSPIFIIWITMSLILSISVYIDAFFFFEKIVPTIATTLVIFIIDLFLGIELVNKLNKFLRRITIL